MLRRRGIIGAFAGLVAAPAVVRADSIMRINPIRKTGLSPVLAMPYIPENGAIYYNTADMRYYMFDAAARLWKAAWDEIDTRTGVITEANNIVVR